MADDVGDEVEDDAVDEAGDVGPRGGTTTRRPGLQKKNFWFPEDLAEWLRRVAFERRWTEADVVRFAVEELKGKEEAGGWPEPGRQQS